MIVPISHYISIFRLLSLIRNVDGNEIFKIYTILYRTVLGFARKHMGYDSVILRFHIEYEKYRLLKNNRTIEKALNHIF